MVYARRQTRPKQRTAKTMMFPAPVGGWISNRSLAQPQGAQPGAAVLDNYFPRSSTVKLRRGRALYATLENTTLPVTSLFSYRNGNNQKLFGANEEKIYDLTTVASPYAAELVTEEDDLIVTQDGDWFGWGSTDGLDVMTGLTGGDWSVVQYATTGGVFLVGVNGVDPGFIYDGTTFDSIAATITFDGTTLTSADMSFVWVYAERLWFIQKDSQNAWYMDVDQIAGVAKLFPLAGIFDIGGSLLFGQTWSLASGELGGLSEQCVFVSNEGQVAVYQGINPDQAAGWSKVGVYRIGRPLGKKAFFRGGGDLAIATSVGLVPLSKAIELDVTSLNVATVSYNISDAWSDAVQRRGSSNWVCELWPDQKMAIISPPDVIGGSEPTLFVVNAETGAWCRFTNWNVTCMEVFQGRLYFGSPNGKVFLANVSGKDENDVYTGTIIPMFVDCGSPMSMKVGGMIRGVSRANANMIVQATINYDFDEQPPSPPDATTSVEASLWGTGIWGSAKWGEAFPTIVNQCWQSGGGEGYVLAPCYQVSSGSIGPLDEEVIRIDLSYTEAAIIT